MGRWPASVNSAEGMVQLERAAAEPLALIDQHRDRAHWRSKPFLEMLRDPMVLFDVELTYGTLLDTAKAQGDLTTAMIQFHKDTEQSLWDYVEARRLETAINLLVDSEISVGYITGLVGFPSQNKLCNAMKRLYGVRPTDIRKKRLPCDPVRLARTGGHLTTPADPQDAVSSTAQELWTELQLLPYEEQRALVRAIRFHSRDFIDILGKQYLIASRTNRRRGVEAAELAVLSAETNAEALGEAAHDVCALAYAWVANARRLALDYAGAEEAMRKAEEAWKEPCEWRDRRTAAEIFALKGTLRFYQRDFDHSVVLLNQAIKESRQAGASRLLVQCLLLRAGVMDYARVPKPTLPGLQEALRVLHDLDEPRLTLGTHMILAYSYTVAEQHHESLKELAEAWVLWEQLPTAERDPLLPPQLRWNEGLARHGLGEPDAAEALYEESRAAFIALDEGEHAAVVALDLARLCRERGRPSDVLRLASEALPALEGLKIPEAEEALALLRAALEKSVVSTAVLETVRATLVRIQRVHRR